MINLNSREFFKLSICIIIDWPTQTKIELARLHPKIWIIGYFKLCQMDLNNIANLFYKHSLVISFNHQLSNLMGFEGPFIGVMGRFNRAFWVLMGQSHHWKLEPVLPLMAEIARNYLHLLRGCSQPQAMWSPSWGVPWIHRTWRWLFFSMRTWRKSKWPTTATSYPTQLLVSLLTK